jgi:hypothetical protein
LCISAIFVCRLSPRPLRTDWKLIEADHIEGDIRIYCLEQVSHCSKPAILRWPIFRAGVDCGEDILASNPKVFRVENSRR